MNYFMKYKIQEKNIGEKKCNILINKYIIINILTFLYNKSINKVLINFKSINKTVIVKLIEKIIVFFP